jgi:hypothetical protein
MMPLSLEYGTAQGLPTDLPILARASGGGNVLKLRTPPATSEGRKPLFVLHPRHGQR